MRAMKRFLSILLALCMLLSLLPGTVFAAGGGTSFSDVKGTDWYSDSVEYAVEKGIMTGTGDNTFSPNGITTRGMLVTILYRMEGSPAVSAMSFKDVQAGAYYANGVYWAAANGILTGYGDSSFGPNDPVTREQMATILYRYFQYKHYVTRTVGDVTDYADGASVSSYAVEAMNWAVGFGVLSGSSGNRLNPASNATRAEVATILMRFDQAITEGSTRPNHGNGNTSSGGGQVQISTYTVTFDYNYGNKGTYETVTVTDGQTVDSPANPSRFGYLFMGWYTKASGGERYDFDDAVEQDLTLYARWMMVPVIPDGTTPGPEGTFTVTFETNGGSAVQSQTVEEGAMAQEPTSTRGGYRLVAWYQDEALTIVYDFNAPVTANITLYAKWELVSSEEETFLDETDAQVEIYSFEADYQTIKVNTPTQVTFTAEIFADIPSDDFTVGVIQDGQSVGEMYDDGTNGDEVADDGIYTLQTTLTHSTEADLEYYAQAGNVTSDTVKIHYYEPLTDQEQADMEEVDTAIAELMAGDGFDSKSEAEQKEAVEQELQSLAEEGLIQEDTIAYDETTKLFTYQYSSGVYGGVSLAEMSDDINGQGGVESLNSADMDIYAANTTRAGTSQYSALVLNGFENKAYRRDYYNSLQSDWNAMGLQTTVDTTVTVADIKTLLDDDYDVIIFAMHGSKYSFTGGTRQPVLCMNEQVTAQTDRNYDYEINGAHSVARVYCTDEAWHYWVMPSLFGDTYSSQALDGKLIFSESCMFYGCDCQSTTPDHTLARAFTDLSAEAVVGYHNSVDADYSRDVMKYTIEETFGGKTIQAALNAATARYGADDDWSDSAKDKYAAYPVLDGDTNFILRESDVGFITGSVKSADTSRVIEGALIRVYTLDGDQLASTRTAADGTYRVEIGEGTYVVKVSAGSYKSAKMQVTVRRGQQTPTETFLLISPGFDLDFANGSITNSITGTLVPGVSINVRANWNNESGIIVSRTSTNNRGYFEIEAAPGAYTIEYYKTGYVTGYKNIIVFAGLGDQDAVISPVTSDSAYRVVLTWGQDPRDLDSHMEGCLSDGNSFHVYFAHKSEYDGDVEICNLDLDDVTSYGPETITLNANTSNPYYYYVYRFSGTGTVATSGAQVKLYRGSELLDTYYVPIDQGNGDYWNVFAIVDGQIIVKNTITDTQDVSYAGAISNQFNAVNLSVDQEADGNTAEENELKEAMENAAKEAAAKAAAEAY